MGYIRESHIASKLTKAPAYRHTMQRLEDVKRSNSQGDGYWVGREIYGVLGYPFNAGTQHKNAARAREAELSSSEAADRKRLATREKVTAAAKRVGDAAKDAGVTRYGLFNNARYQGLYDANCKEVWRAKGVAEGEDLFERAGALELSAHEFQMNLAAEKIANEGINGERQAINANLAVARDVKATIAKQGITLGALPPEREPIKSVKKRLTAQARLPSK